MSGKFNERIMLLLSIVECGRGKKLMETLDGKNIRMHFQSVGFGTAPTEMMDIFGIGSNNKDIVFSLASESVVKELMADFGNNFSSYSEYGGLMLVLGLSAVNRLAAQIMSLNLSDENLKGADVRMKSEHKHNLVMITIGQGYADEVMQTAKKAGASGGTIIRGRLAEAEKLKELANVDVGEEREIIFIMAASNIANQIMEAVNKEFGLRTEARGIMCTIPIEKVYKI